MTTPRMVDPIDAEPLAASSPVSGLSIVVEEFKLDASPTRHQGPTEWIGIEAAQQIARGLQKLGANARVAAAGTSISGDVYVRGRITRIDGGSRAARVWAGFGAGGAALAVAGSVTSASGEEFGAFTRERRSGVGSLDSTFLIEKCNRVIGSDIAKMIATGVYTGAPEGSPN